MSPPQQISSPVGGPVREQFSTPRAAAVEPGMSRWQTARRFLAASDKDTQLLLLSDVADSPPNPRTIGAENPLMGLTIHGIIEHKFDAEMAPRSEVLEIALTAVEFARDEDLGEYEDDLLTNDYERLRTAIEQLEVQANRCLVEIDRRKALGVTATPPPLPISNTFARPPAVERCATLATPEPCPQ